MTTTSALTPSQPEAPWSVVFDTKGGAQPAPLETADGAAAIGPLTWVHLHPGDSDHFLLSQVGVLPPKVAEYFAQPAGQVRLVAVADGLLMTLRGLEQPPGGLPAELPSIQVWLGRNRVVTSASSVPVAIREIYFDLMAGAGPKGPADFLGRLALLLIRNLGPSLDDNSGPLDLLETRILSTPSGSPWAGAEYDPTQPAAPAPPSFPTAHAAPRVAPGAWPPSVRPGGNPLDAAGGIGAGR